MDNHNKIKVMVVDDSVVIRGMFSNVLNSDADIEVVSTAANGRIALDYLKREGGDKIDVITLDIEMPGMDGLTALPEILKIAPNIKIIMASSLSTKGASETLQALSMGATDYMAKPDKGGDRKIMHEFARELVEKVRVLGKSGKSCVCDSSKVVSILEKISTKKNISNNFIIRKKNSLLIPSAIAIGSSTGGPQALYEFFSSLKGKNIKIPIFVTQHMPAKFTTLLAEQITRISGINCFEVSEGMDIKVGNIYLAAGDYHMIIKMKDDGSKFVHLSKREKENFCRPAVDLMLASLVPIYKGNLLVVIMTGMGNDGLKGSEMIVNSGGMVIAQDKESSVVWGMPGAVVSAGLCSSIMPISEMAGEIINLSKGRIL